ncbi:MAG: T9SS type A sorting domain-containing protein, partial [Pyrinomonadaceae bacterium]|nr:T9SS type A sorting domain-containing protein [Sphingobacteriaceae bacterium]
YEWSPATYLSSLTGSVVEFAPTQAGSYTIMVEAKSQSGCIAQTAVTLHVIDVRCGNKMDKVLVCKGENDKNKDNCISPNAVNTHLQKGGKLGSCTMSNSTESIEKSGDEGKHNNYTLNAYPNPFNKSTTVSFNLPKSQNKVSLEIYDLNGNKVKQLYEGPADANRVYNFQFEISSTNERFFMVRLVTADGLHTFRLIKD